MTTATTVSCYLPHVTSPDSLMQRPSEPGFPPPSSFSMQPHGHEHSLPEIPSQFAYATILLHNLGNPYPLAVNIGVSDDRTNATI